MNKLQVIRRLSLLCLAASFPGMLVTAEELGPGMTAMRPTSMGQFVRTEQGYMVPYKVRIPGSKVAFEMVPVPGGSFKFGSAVGDGDRAACETPQVEVTLAPFWIGRYEVTWAEYGLYYKLYKDFAEFEKAKVRPVTEENRLDAVTAPSVVYDPSLRWPDVEAKEIADKYPASSMTQYAAKQYTKWLSKLTGEFYRLPSEVEWEYACRAGTKTRYHFGDDFHKLGEYAWYFDNSHEMPQPVGNKKPNGWGLHDMYGNVAEWVLDQMDVFGHEQLGRQFKAGKGTVIWPTNRFPRVVRGGSWDSDPLACRSAARHGSSLEWFDEDPQLPHSPWWLANSDMQNQVGFRIVRPLARPAKELQTRCWDADTPELRAAVHTYCEKMYRSRRGLVDPTLPVDLERLKLRKK